MDLVHWKQSDMMRAKKLETINAAFTWLEITIQCETRNKTQNLCLMLSSPHNEVGHWLTDRPLSLAQHCLFVCHVKLSVHQCLSWQAVFLCVHLPVHLSVNLSATHLEPVVGPAAKLHLAVLVIKWEPGDVDLTRGLEDPWVWGIYLCFIQGFQVECILHDAHLAVCRCRPRRWWLPRWWGRCLCRYYRYV